MILEPMLATEESPTRLPAYVADPGWALQEKIDGHRALLSIADGTATAYGRDGQVSQHTERLRSPHHLPCYALLRGHVALDGEYVNGVLHVFDLVYRTDPGGTVLPAMGFGERLAGLHSLFEAGCLSRDLFRLVPTATTHEAKAELALECVRRPAEGVIARRLSAPYYPGTTSTGVVKLKFVKDADLVVIGLRHKGKDNAVLGAYEPGNPVPVPVGRASTNGKDVIAIGDVVLVRYQRFTKGGRLREPRILARRTDKPAAECTIDQLLGGPRA